MGLDGIILSGGNDLADLPNAIKSAPERDACEKNLLSWADNLRVPVLGICRGMQMINCFLGGSLNRVQGHIELKHNVKPCTKNNFFLNYVSVNSFHRWGMDVNNLPSSLIPLLIADDGSVEAFQHVSKPWLGIMWHPERENGHNFDLDCNLLKAHFFN
jgi:putative glutamine amidotransferase